MTGHAALPSRLIGATAGVCAAGLGLGVAEVVAATSRDLQSPVLDVGDRFIDAVPAGLKNLAIDLFGTNDKTALLAGIAIVLAVYAAVVGVVAVRKSRIIGTVGVGLFGLVGVLAALTSRRGAPWWSVLPSLGGTVAACAALWWLARRGASHPAGADGQRPETSSPAVPGRRQFLVSAAAVTAVAAVAGSTGRWLQGRFSAAMSRAAVVLPGARQKLPPVDLAAVSAPVDGVSDFVTSNTDFYRIDTRLTVPQVPAETYRLDITGMVESPLTLTYEELLSRDLIERDITLTCVSNEVGGKLVGTARWLGVRLDDLLDEVGIDPRADQIVGRSVDGWTCGFPVAALDGRDALIAVAMNGEPLPLAHGFPARLVVPGLYGYVSATKWLVEIELTRFDRFKQYWADGRGWDDQAPIKTQTRIDTPRGLTTVPTGPLAIGGVAWAQRRGVEQVEIRVDDGPWVAANLADELTVDTWRQWSYVWDATPGRHTVTARATDGRGAIQTEARSEPMPNGATGWHQVVVLVNDSA